MDQRKLGWESMTQKIPNFFTGSSETEGELRLWAHHAGGDLNAGVPRSVFTNEYYWKTMTIGRNGPGDPYPGSECFDDTGGFFVVGDDGLVYLTEKAKGCARLW